MHLQKIEEIFTTFEQINPQPQTELDYTNNFTLLVAVVLSAQATDKSVNLATQDLFKKHDSPEKIIELGIDGLKPYIKTINFYPTKAKNIIALSEILIKKYNSQVPNNLDDLTTLPGVGRKTANVVLGAAFGIAVMPVDTHVSRVAIRLALAKPLTPDKIEKELVEKIPEKWLYNAHHWLVLHGRYICKARKPLCDICPVSKFCEYYSNIDKGKK